MRLYPATISRRRRRRIAAAIPRLEAALDDHDDIDRKTRLAPGFAGPRRRIVDEMRTLLGKAPFYVPRRPKPFDLFIATFDTYLGIHRLFRQLERPKSTTDRHAYPRSRREE